MTTFYICRHGETENNKNGRLQGWIDTPLTEQGVKDALSTASKLNGVDFDEIISSDLSRSFMTAYLIAREIGYIYEIETTKGLREVNFGDLANLPYADYPKISAAENTNYVCPNGESQEQMRIRVIACINVIGQENPDKTILLVGHDGTVNAIRATFTNIEMGLADKTSNAHDFVAKVLFEDGKIASFEEIGN